MKKLLILLLTIVVAISCSQQEESTFDKESRGNMLDLSKKNVLAIKNKIELEIAKTKISSIKSIKAFGEMYIVDYENIDGKINSVGFENLINKSKVNTSKVIDLTVDTGYYIYCTGSCDCHLEGVLDENGGYAQCSCSECVMHWSPKYTGNRANEIKKSYDIEELAIESYKSTFNETPKNLKVMDMAYTEYKGARIYTFTYIDDKNIPSTFMVVKNYKNPNLVSKSTIKANSSKVQQLDGDFTIDCTGSCDCRERFFPATGAIECTCSPCKMKVTELKEDGGSEGGGN